MIALVNMPFSDIARPSLALGLLKAELLRAGLNAEVIYANLFFAQQAGIHASSLPLRIWHTSLIGEWIFASAAFPDFTASDDRYLEACLVPFAKMYLNENPGPLAHALMRELRRLRKTAPAFVDTIARRLLENRPMIVGCSSTYSQQTATLALLRRVRELDPEVVTIIGGANVAGTMGQSVLRNFPWVDAVCPGEADETVVPLCRLVMDHGRSGLAKRPLQGIMTRHSSSQAAPACHDIPCTAAIDMNGLPLPDYDDYFMSLSTFSESDRSLIHVAVPMETSRGCWWADKRPCMFCGLNTGTHAYRAKNPERALVEMKTIAKRYGLREFVMTDNVMPADYTKSVFKRLEQLQAPYEIFYEIRPFLPRVQARQLSSAGIRHVQAGIESLHDELLSLMNKGASTLWNIALLKHARAFGITVGWNLLTGVPGERDAWYNEMADWLPLVHHLQPPASLHGITLQRFSQFMAEPEKYGLKPVPYSSYNVIYPFPQQTISEIAYYFRDASWPEFYPEVNRQTPGIQRLMAAVDDWRNAFYSPSPPLLILTELDSGALKFMDNRSCAVSKEHILTGLPASIYRIMEDPVDQKTLSVKIAERGISVSPETLSKALEKVLSARLALARFKAFVSLATPEKSVQFQASPTFDHTAETAFRRYLSMICR